MKRPSPKWSYLAGKKPVAPGSCVNVHRHRQAAIEDKVVAGNPATGVGEIKHAGIGDILRLAQAQRSQLGMFVNASASLVQRFQHGSAYITGHDTVGTNTLFGNLQGQ